MKHRNDLKLQGRSGFRQKAGRFLFSKNAALCRDAATNWLCVCSLLICISANAALPSGWPHTQEFSVAAPGLVKFSLPVETLDAARPALEDLRVYDGAGNELPFLITRPVPSAKAVQSAR